MIRLVDFLAALGGLLLLCPVLLLVYLIGLFDTGSPVFSQQRVGRNQKSFNLLKFRTMHVTTKSVASHLVDQSAITSFGRFLRKTKIDELPQLINVLKGEMSLVGPRPNLYSQEELIAEREIRGVYHVRPGITGLAQVQGIDMSTPKLLAEVDQEMIENMTLSSYLTYIFQTLKGEGLGDAAYNQKK